QTAPPLLHGILHGPRETPKKRVRDTREKCVPPELVGRIAALIESRLGRPLEPFDIWYSGFRQRSPFPEAQLDEVVSRRYPTPDAFRQDIPRLLGKLGFSPERAQYLADRIVVDPSRGAGHAMGAEMRSE